jgi:hypothetical protein
MPRLAAEIEADIAALRAAIGSGAARVRYADGREVTYRGQADLERALARLEEELNGTAAQPRVTYAAHARD